jgi:hypothetical protein
MPVSSATVRKTRGKSTAAVSVAAVAAMAGVAAAAVAGCSATSSSPAGDAVNPAPVSVSIPDRDGPGVTADAVAISWGGWLIPGKGAPERRQRENDALAAVVDTFNQQGGLGGRKVRLLPAEQDPGARLTNERSEAFVKGNHLPLPDPSNGKAACDAYAQSPVFALLSPRLAGPPFGTAAAGACLNAAGHPVVGVDGWTRSDFRAAPATAGLGLAADRRVDALIAGGKDAGIIGTPGKTAVVTDSTAPGTSTAELAALAKAGVADPTVLPVNPQLSAAEALNLVVKLKSGGIERLISLRGSDVSFDFFENLAPVLKQQQFYPRTLVLDGPGFGAMNYGAHGLPAAMTDSFAFYASKPVAGSRADPALAAQADATPARKLCAAAAAAHPALAQQLVSDTDLCDQLELLKAAFAASGSTRLNAQAFTAGLNKLAGYSSPELIKTGFGPDRHDGAAGIVRVRYSASCACDVNSAKVIPF